jgi:hypothetical protein
MRHAEVCFRSFSSSARRDFSHSRSPSRNEYFFSFQEVRDCMMRVMSSSLTAWIGESVSGAVFGGNHLVASPEAVTVSGDVVGGAQRNTFPISSSAVCLVTAFMVSKPGGAPEIMHVL